MLLISVNTCKLEELSGIKKVLWGKYAGWCEPFSSFSHKLKIFHSVHDLNLVILVDSISFNTTNYTAQFWFEQMRAFFIASNNLLIRMLWWKYHLLASFYPTLFGLVCTEYGNEWGILYPTMLAIPCFDLFPEFSVLLIYICWCLSTLLSSSETRYKAKNDHLW